MDEGMDEPLLVDESSSVKKMRVDKTRGMPHIHRILLSPWEKWGYHGRFPWKLLCHVLLLLCTMTQIFVYDAQNLEYIQASYRNWVYFFLPNGPTILQNTELRLDENLYTINGTIDAVAQMRDAYFDIGSLSMANYEYHVDKMREPLPIALEVTQKWRGKSNTTRYNITKTSLGPLDNTADIFYFFRTLSNMKFHMKLRDIDYGPLYFDCFDWDIHLSIERVQTSHLRMVVEPGDLHICSSENLWRNIRHGYLWLNVVIFVVCCIYLVLSIKSIVRSIRMFSQAKKSAQQALNHESDVAQGMLRTWQEVPLLVKLQFFKTQYIFITVALAFVGVNSVLNLSKAVAFVPLSEPHLFIQALGPLLLCFTFVGYLEHNAHLYSIVLTLRWAVPKVLYFLAGVSPIFFGYAIFGSIAFGSRETRFSGLQQSCVTLFSIMNGDIILETFDALKLDFPVIGAFYVYSFIALFLYIVLNIFIAIVEESYFATRSYKRSLEVLSNGLFANDSNADQQRLMTDAFRILLRVLENSEQE
ncbi:mucolipin [Thraustotheca clavata]|uniref:Mucolipin n=1 Tax=Thraustotheca clavata TaxID=74557 RepID=A0A1V9ZIF7_9STRA|nr:mucolipin [Thraustotheca clavata]